MITITRHLAYKANLGNYEHVEFGASVTVTEDDVTIDPDCSPARRVEILDRFANEQLDLMLAPDLAAAAKLSVKEDSFTKVDPPPAPTAAPKPSTRPRKRN